MTYFLKKLGISIVFFLLLAPIGRSALVGEEVRKAQNLPAVLSALEPDLEVRLATWNSLKGGNDEDAKGRARFALEELRRTTMNRCRELTGLTTPEEGKQPIRIKRKFFKDLAIQYRAFQQELSARLMGEASQSLSVADAQLYGNLVAISSQRGSFYESVFDLFAANQDAFKRTGAGASLSLLPGFSAAFGEYYESTNLGLALLSVLKEEVSVAKDIGALLVKFHNPLGIKDRINYGPYSEEKFVALRRALEGDLTPRDMEDHREKLGKKNTLEAPEAPQAEAGAAAVPAGAGL